MLPQKFWQPWSEIDPDGSHGGIIGELGSFVAPQLGDNTSTKNIDMFSVYRVLQECAASLSMHPEAMREGPPLRNAVEETLRALNGCFERVIDASTTMSTNIFMWTHATPPFLDLTLRPIRYPLRNLFLNNVVYFFLGTLVETAEANANSLHSGIDSSTSHRLIAPLYHLKSTTMKNLFDVEVENEITQEELAEIYANISQPGPTITLPGQTAPTASDTDVAEVLSGASVLQWYPSEADWTKFGQKYLVGYKAERVWQPEGAIGTTEDVSPEQPTPPAPPAPSTPG